MRWIFFVTLTCLQISCSFDGQAAADKITVPADSIPILIDPSGNTVESRFPAPEGFVRTLVDSNSFAAWLRQLPLLPDGSPVLLYNGKEKTRQDVHCAVLDFDTGKRNLQQCADAVIRLRAEFLFSKKHYAEIHFNFSNGFNAEYVRWRRGERIRVDGNRVYWTMGGAASDTYASFRSYLDMVFAYAGTASLERELRAVEPTTLRPGDVWIKGGYPGHAVIVLDVVEDAETGKKQFLLAQSYMPAQQIHVLRNPKNVRPWYSTEEIDQGLTTPEWFFEKKHLRRFEDK